jgi:hypothetical protein
MSLEFKNQITGKCYRIYGANSGVGLNLSTKKTYCIDHSHPMINILGIWESAEDCLKLYGGDVARNRIGGTGGFITDATCWDVLSQIHDIQQIEQKRRWYFRKAGWGGGGHVNPPVAHNEAVNN